MESAPSDVSALQLQTLRLYGELVSRAPSWGGRLVLATGEGASSTGLPAAVSIAGGAALLIDPDEYAVKSVFRQGGIDFVVTTLDEALRILKNEIRKHTPVSVAVIATLSPVIAEINERGVQADFQIVCGSKPHSTIDVDAVPLAVERLELQTDGRTVQPSAFASQWLASQGWSERSVALDNVVDLRNFNSRLLALEGFGNLRGNWVRRISQYQRAAVGAGRLFWLSTSEEASLSS